MGGMNFPISASRHRIEEGFESLGIRIADFDLLVPSIQWRASDMYWS